MGKPSMAKRTDPNLALFSLSSAPSSPSSSSSSDFEFTISLSPTSKKPSHLCPADELFYKGQLLPLHISPRLDMVRTLLASSSSSSSSSDSATTGSRDSNGSSNDSSFTSDILLLHDCDSSRPSSATDDDDFKKPLPSSADGAHGPKKSKYFSLSLFSSVFLRGGRDKSATTNPPASASTTSGRKIGASAKEVIKKYVRKVRPLYGRFSPAKNAASVVVGSPFFVKQAERTSRDHMRMDYQESGSGASLIEEVTGCYRHSSFSGNLNPRCTRRGPSFAVSCPSSMRSSPSHSGVLRPGPLYSDPITTPTSSSSSMEDLQSAIQGAIAHCKNSMAQGSLKKSVLV